jgi:hypothetical protein
MKPFKYLQRFTNIPYNGTGRCGTGQRLRPEEERLRVIVAQLRRQELGIRPVLVSVCSGRLADLWNEIGDGFGAGVEGHDIIGGGLDGGASGGFGVPEVEAEVLADASVSLRTTSAGATMTKGESTNKHRLEIVALVVIWTRTDGFQRLRAVSGDLALVTKASSDDRRSICRQSPYIPLK